MASNPGGELLTLRWTAGSTESKGQAGHGDRKAHRMVAPGIGFSDQSPTPYTAPEAQYPPHSEHTTDPCGGLGFWHQLPGSLALLGLTGTVTAWRPLQQGAEHIPAACLILST